MAYIAYVDESRIPEADRVADRDNIVRIHGVHPRSMRLHYELYRQLMRAPGPVPRALREMIAVVVSATNGCRY